MDIIKETASWIAVYKPAGVAVQTRRVGEPDLESELLNYLRNQDARREAVPYLAVIHRLDQPVEGVVLAAKSPAAAASESRKTEIPFA